MKLSKIILDKIESIKQTEDIPAYTSLDYEYKRVLEHGMQSQIDILEWVIEQIKQYGEDNIQLERKKQ